jgi:hypothetical protein
MPLADSFDGPPFDAETMSDAPPMVVRGRLPRFVVPRNPQPKLGIPFKAALGRFPLVATSSVNGLNLSILVDLHRKV